MDTRPQTGSTSMNILLFGAGSEAIAADIRRHPNLRVAQDQPDVILCYGGDGTLLSAERQWPGVPKVPIRNSRRGKRMIAHPPADVVDRLAAGKLVPAQFLKLECRIETNSTQAPPLAMNEFNVQPGMTNSAIRYRIWIDGDPFEDGVEIIGDGFVVSTPFGSAAYYKQITRGIFYAGMGIAFKYTSELINHVVVPDTAAITAEITRGPAVLAYDNAPDSFGLDTGARLHIRKAHVPATILTVDPMRHPSDEF